MTGNSHKAIGIAVGAAFTIYGYQNGIPAAALALVSAPIGAMLPDIDHSGSKAGRIRKTAADVAIVVAATAMVGAAVYYGWYNVDYMVLIAIGLGVALPLTVLAALSRTKHVRDFLGFATMHRGIMHTLLLPVCMFFAARHISSTYILILLWGGMAGYVSHIFADCITKRGCPILFPLTQKSISLTKMNTGSRAEKICVAVIVIVVIAVPFFL